MGLVMCKNGHNEYKAKTQRAQAQRGVSLMAMAFLITGIGLFSLPAIQIYKAQNNLAAKAETDSKISNIQKALGAFYAQNGRYPCPAPLTAPIDGTTPTGAKAYGVEVNPICSTGGAGTERAAGRDGRFVRTGAVPTRTLGISDSYMSDGYNQRFVYSVTEAYAMQGTPAPSDSGAITIRDGANNVATSVEGNVAYLVYSAGGDINGAYDINGNRMQACNASARNGQNCDYNTNAIFMNTLQKSRSTTVANQFSHTIAYAPNKDVVPCDDSLKTGQPMDTIFLIDTSGSMSTTTGKCPTGLSGNCSRMDVAHWAMRRVIPARMYSNTTTDTAGSTGITGFRCTSTATCGNASTFNNITFDDPNAANYTAPTADAVNKKLENTLQGLCPSGGTPLGEHIKALGDKLKAGTVDRPNKLTILSDGESNQGIDPVAAARELISKYPNLQVDVVDMTNNSGLRQIADLTGGKYYSANNPQELEDSLYDSAGVCRPHTPAPVVDKKNCGG